MLFLRGIHEDSLGWYVREETPVSYCRVYYVRTGKVSYRDKHIEKKLKTGYLYVFPSTIPYEMEQEKEYPLSCLFLHLDITPYLLSELLELPVEEGTFLQSLLSSIEVWMTVHPGNSVDAVIESLAASLVAYLISEEYFAMAPGKIANSVCYISEHVAEKITVEELSKQCGYHKQYYIRLFQLYLGTTPYQYLISYRMKTAVSMLMHGKSVSETAELVGYPEIRNFIRAFKKYYGCLPGQVKNLMPFERR